VGLDLVRLLTFVTVVDRNGYSAAARHLHLAQATVSHHVHELERALGTQLLRYEHRAVHLTAAGHEVYRTARLMLREQDHLGVVLDDLRQGRRGQVRLGTSMALEHGHFFTRVIAPFCRNNVGIRLSIRFGHSPREARAVLDRELDLAYVIDWNLPSEVEFEPIGKATFAFLVPPGHPLTCHDVVTMDQVAGAGLITAPLNSIEAVYYDEVLRESGLDSDASILEIDGMQARVLAAIAGLGVFGTFLPDGVGAQAVPPLVALPVDASLTKVDMGLVTRPDGVMSAGVRALAEWMRTTMTP